VSVYDNEMILIRGVVLEKYILNSVMGSDMFLNPSCHEADKLRSLMVSPILEHNEIKSQLVILFFHTYCFCGFCFRLKQRNLWKVVL